MKCLLVSYTGPGVNSTEHAAAMACGLARCGWDVRLATAPPDPYWADFSFFSCAPDGSLQELPPAAVPAPADVVHVWTPRMPIWRFLAAHGRLVGGSLVLHLEDDEDEVLNLMGNGSLRRGAQITRAGLRAGHLEEWTHPELSTCLAHAVEGTTILSPELVLKIPDTTPYLHVIPPLGPQWSGPVAFDELPAEAQAGEPMVVYSGGIHPAVADDFFQLCRAVQSLVDRGQRLRLVRCGPAVLPELLETARNLCRSFCDLGHLPIPGLRALLARASVLVQPGAPTAFNRRRFPSKLAPYLASGTPVIMPSCYPWLGVKSGEHALLLARSEAGEIARALAQVLADPEKARAMAVRAAAFAAKRFDLEACCRPLDEFYRKLPAGTRIPWRQLKRPRVELPLLLAEAARASRVPWNGWPWRAPRREVLQPTMLRAARTGRFHRTLPTPERLVRLAVEEVRQPSREPAPVASVAQFYWPDGGDYSENAADALPYLSGRWRRLTFGPHACSGDIRPRLDPGNRPGIYEVAAIVYREPAGPWRQRLAFDDAAVPAFIAHGTILPLAGRHRSAVRWLSTGTDPQLYLPPPSRTGMVCIDCWIKWTPLG